MEPHSKLQYSVTFDEPEYVSSTDSAEAVNGAERKFQPSDQSPTPVTKTSSAAAFGGESGDINSESSISTSVLDDGEEIKALKRKIYELEARNKLLDHEIEKVNLCLINERTKNSKLEKKLQFVKDNQDVFIKLKEAYINMKYNEAAGRKMIEVREKGLQTWDGILCRACIDTEQLRRQLQGMQETYQESFIVKPFQLEQILNTVKYLKDMVDRREQAWSFNAERDEKLRTHIDTLESENSTLRDILKTRESRVVEGTFAGDSDLTMYRKIIVKYEKTIREIEKTSKGSITVQVSFNEKEKKIILHLMDKYLSSKRDKSLENGNSSRTSKVTQ